MHSWINVFGEWPSLTMRPVVKLIILLEKAVIGGFGVFVWGEIVYLVGNERSECG